MAAGDEFPLAIVQYEGCDGTAGNIAVHAGDLTAGRVPYLRYTSKKQVKRTNLLVGQAHTSDTYLYVAAGSRYERCTDGIVETQRHCARQRTRNELFFVLQFSTPYSDSSPCSSSASSGCDRQL